MMISVPGWKVLAQSAWPVQDVGSEKDRCCTVVDCQFITMQNAALVEQAFGYRSWAIGQKQQCDGWRLALAEAHQSEASEKICVVWPWDTSLGSLALQIF